MNSKKSKKGITLVETILYLALFAIVMILVVQFVLRINYDQQKTKHRLACEQNIMLIDRHLNSIFKTGTSIDLDHTIFDPQNSKLRITREGEYYEYTVQDNVMYFDRNGTQNRISLPDLNIESFKLERINNKAGMAIGVSVEIEIFSTKGNFTKKIKTSYLLDIY